MLAFLRSAVDAVLDRLNLARLTVSGMAGEDDEALTGRLAALWQGAHWTRTRTQSCGLRW